MQSNSAPPSEIDEATRFGRLITSVFRQWRRQIDQVFKDMDLSEATRMPIIMLYDHGEVMRQKELAEALALDSSSLFRILNTLRDRELVTWHVDPSDRRAKCISLTPAGRLIARQILDRSVAIERSTLADFDPAALAVTRAVLEETLRRLEKQQD